MSSLVWLGVSMEVCASIVGTIGKQMIRHGAVAKKSQYIEKLFQYTGLLLTTLIGPILDLAAYTFAPQSMIAPFNGLDVAWNTALAPFTLGETLTKRKLIAILTVAAGVFSTLAFVHMEEPEYTSDYMREVVFSWRTFVYLILFGCFIGYNLRVQRRYPKGDNRRGLSLGITGGSLAGNMFCVKLIGEIIQDSASSESFFERFGQWFEEDALLVCALLFGTVLFSVSNIKFMAEGMREFEALYMVTLYEGSIIVSGCLCGTVIMRDFDRGSWFNPIGFYACILLIILGLYLLFVAQMRASSSLFAGTASIVLDKRETLSLRPSSPGALSETNPDQPLPRLSRGGGVVSNRCAASGAPAQDCAKDSAALGVEKLEIVIDVENQNSDDQISNLGEHNLRITSTCSSQQTAGEQQQHLHQTTKASNSTSEIKSVEGTPSGQLTESTTGQHEAENGSSSSSSMNNIRDGGNGSSGCTSSGTTITMQETGKSKVMDGKGKGEIHDDGRVQGDFLPLACATIDEGKEVLLLSRQEQQQVPSTIVVQLHQLPEPKTSSAQRTNYTTGAKEPCCGVFAKSSSAAATSSTGSSEEVQEDHGHTSDNAGASLQSPGSEQDQQPTRVLFAPSVNEALLPSPLEVFQEYPFRRNLSLVRREEEDEEESRAGSTEKRPGK
ncbi:unnamed protein product [Amoebophrya sp. A120]|nr:unnamed protein product [Amoebophrya sp. A120]|eukprot:GSA120T00016835001.1